MAYASWRSAASRLSPREVPKQGGTNATRSTNCRWAAQRSLNTTCRFRQAASDKV